MIEFVLPSAVWPGNACWCWAFVQTPILQQHGLLAKLSCSAHLVSALQTLCDTLLQNVGVPGQSLRSGRISKLTERFSEYKSQTLDNKISALDQRAECDPELIDVVAALCDLGQQSSI